MLSSKKTIKTVLPKIDLRKGIKGSLVHDFYKKHPKTFPYKKSLRSLLKALEWPKAENYDAIHEYPKGVTFDWGNVGQGVANDGKNWFFSCEDALWKIPAHFDLGIEIDEDTPSVIKKGLDEDDMPYLVSKGVEHLGDLDYFKSKGQSKGQLYVPAEGGKGVIALFDAETLNYIVSSDPLTSQEGSVPWCAINPLNGLLYSSKFKDSYLSLCVYDRAVLSTTSPDKGIFRLELTFLGNFDLYDEDGNRIVINAIQGGVFSKNGHFYLVCDTAHDKRDKGEVRNSGIYGFDMLTGRRVFHKVVPYNPSFHIDEELEGIDIWDLDSGGAPNIGGQIHLLMTNYNWYENDNIYLKHFRIEDAVKDKI
ncbi:MAG: hypothetical protein ACM3X1_07125 [Ignavibacteriales bacterium]